MASERNDFIRDIIDADLRAGRHTRVATRFPPEPNGYLHIGHAKSICLNFGIAQDYQGTCNLRYDDTNPAKEDIEYVESIEHDVRWLGYPPSAVLFSADYFPKMYELAERLVREGKAYVCDLTDDEIRTYRGTLSEPGKPSPFRDRSVDENLKLLRGMKAGEFPDGARTLRAKIDMAASNMKMRDPLLYRIRHAHHHRTGDAWCIYPMYDWAHPLEDGIEGITHSICTLEFENNRELYDWVLDNTGPWNPRPHQYEFARLALDYTIMSKRKLLALVQNKHVDGWDDPRMPTIAGMRRRGYSPEAIRAFADMIGVAKANSTVDIGKLEYCVRDDLNRTARRAMGVVDPLEVELVGELPASVTAHDFPDDPKSPSRSLPISNRIFIDRDDWRDDPPDGYKRLAPGRTVRLRYGPCITADKIDGGKLYATVVPGTAGGANPTDRKVGGVIHWVDAATSVPAELRLYDRLFTSAKPEEGGADFIAAINPKSLDVKTGRVEASLANAAVGARFQLERVGYFRIDEDSSKRMQRTLERMGYAAADGEPGKLVLNRVVSLTEAKAEAQVASEKPREKNAKAATRPKVKSGPEYRAEARNRDPELAKAYEQAIARGVSAEQADLLTGDTGTMKLFAAAGAKHPDVAAKWIINELPRALGDREIDSVDGAHFAELVAMLAASEITPAIGKQLLAKSIETGKPPRSLHTAAAPTADLGATVDAVIAANPDKAQQYRGGRTGLLGFFVGQVMKAAPGSDAAAVNQAVRDRLG